MSAAAQNVAAPAVHIELLSAASTRLMKRFNAKPIRVRFVSGEDSNATVYQASLGGFGFGSGLRLEVYDASGEHFVCRSKGLYLHKTAACLVGESIDAAAWDQANGTAWRHSQLQALLTDAAGYVLLDLQRLMIKANFDGGAVAELLYDMGADSHRVDGHSHFTAALRVDMDSRSMQLRVLAAGQPGVEACAAILQRVDALDLDRFPEAIPPVQMLSWPVGAPHAVPMAGNDVEPVAAQ